MASSVTERKKCSFGAKCYRKNKQHLKDFWHPTRDEEDLTAAVKDQISVSPSSKQSDKPRLVHDISVNEDDDIHPVNVSPSAARKRKSEDEEEKNDSDPSSSKSPPKAMKLDESNVEKISVTYKKLKKIPKSSSEDVDTAKASIKQFSTKKEKCHFWEKCYQTNKNHLQEFYHPGENVPDDDEISKKATNPLLDGDTVDLENGYKLKRDGDIYSCTCKGFLVQRAPINERTCKHLKHYNGEAFEMERTAVNSKPKPTNIKAHIQVSLLLAHKYEEDKHNPIGWWISEKLDGVRAFWNGNCFYSRLGNAFYAPEWFTKDLPKDIHLDGELFGGRGEFQSTVSIVKTADSPKWKDIKYYVFDGPHMGKDPFEKRMNTIKEYFEDSEPEYAVFVEQTKCISKTQLDTMLTHVLNIGGEGLMIREPKSVYEPTRSKTLLKIKKFYDAEAIVIAHERGKGVNANRCGALRCRMACGNEFSAGSGLTDRQRNSPPKIGSIITYKFQELSKSGNPRFPTFVGIRIDMTEPKDAEIRVVSDE